MHLKFCIHQCKNGICLMRRTSSGHGYNNIKYLQPGNNTGNQIDFESRCKPRNRNMPESAQSSRTVNRCIFCPAVLSTLVVGYLWKYLLSASDLGFVNQVLKRIGVRRKIRPIEKTVSDRKKQGYCWDRWSVNMPSQSLIDEINSQIQGLVTFIAPSLLSVLTLIPQLAAGPPTR